MTIDFIYLRLIGDRRIDEKDFGKIQKERKMEMQKWSKVLKDVKNNESILKTAIVSTNNHYAGFGPLTARIFEDMIDPDMKKVSFPISDYKISGTDDKDFDSYNNSRRYLEPDKGKLDKMRQSSISDFL